MSELNFNQQIYVALWKVKKSTKPRQLAADLHATASYFTVLFRMNNNFILFFGTADYEQTTADYEQS